MYSFNSKVRFSEVNTEKNMDLVSIINYFQDCSTFHSHSIGKGFSYLESRQRVWLLNSWQIIVHRFPAFGEALTISTWPYDFKNMYGYRNFIICDENQEIVAIANSVWINMDSSTYRPAKITKDDIEGYAVEEKYPLEFAPRKINIPSSLTKREPFPVIRANLDTNNHVNNGQYIKMAEEYLPPHFVIHQMRAEYKKSAILGDIIIPMTFYDESSFIVVLSSQDGTPYTIIEFLSKQNILL